YSVVFFFQAEDGIRARNVNGVQTCALPICRYLFHQSIIGVYEFTERYLMISAVFLSMSYVMKLDGHIKLDLFIDRLPKKVSSVFNLLFLLLGAAFVFCIVYQVMIMMYDA